MKTTMMSNKETDSAGESKKKTVSMSSLILRGKTMVVVLPEEINNVHLTLNSYKLWINVSDIDTMTNEETDSADEDVVDSNNVALNVTVSKVRWWSA